jgi:hypothetical protein
MIRFAGFLTGSAASIGMILLILGVPEIKLSDRLLDEKNLETVSQTARDLGTDLEAVAIDVIGEIIEPGEEIPSGITPAKVAMPVPGEPAIEEELSAPPADNELGEARRLTGLTPEPDMIETEPVPSDLKWHAFWNPFRSQIAAEGFVGRLEKVTGLDYRVVKIKTGVYEVTFAYENDEERRNRMSQIAAATGLNLPDS